MKKTFAQKQADKRARQFDGYVQTARLMVIAHDRKNGCSQDQIATTWERYSAELRPFVQAEIDKGTPTINIPRCAASAYIRGDEAPNVDA